MKPMMAVNKDVLVAAWALKKPKNHPFKGVLYPAQTSEFLGFCYLRDDIFLNLFRFKDNKIGIVQLVE